MTADEERAVAKAFQEIKEGKVRTFKNAGEYLKYLDGVIKAEQKGKGS